MLQKILFFTFLCVVLLTIVTAIETKNEETEFKEGPPLGKNEEIKEIMERGRKKKLFYGLGLGGFHALAAVIAIKFKIIVVGMFILGAIFYGFRIWAGKGIGCPEPSIVKEPFYPHGITAYAHTSPEIYSYPYSGHYSSYPTAGAEVISTADVPAEVIASGSHYKRKGKRSVDDEATGRQGTSTNGIDVAEIIFTFLNVREMECKRRFVCEVDFLSRRDPFIRMGYNMFGQSLFQNYRTKESSSVKKYRECLKLFESCKTPDEEEANKVSYVETSPKKNSTTPLKRRKSFRRV
ncbi:uncharacterized protein LOC134829118 [Culicoides brevitarsis]|uniref:uncharacterized protein LOC134829118 n=1 Tax=Culicoides brevitarsis TaxID=469753 RepID=UPI00307C6CAC